MYCETHCRKINKLPPEFDLIPVGYELFLAVRDAI